MDDKLLIQFQRRQISTLREEKAAALEALDLARELGSFTGMSQHQPTLNDLLQDICARANRMIPFKSCAIYLVDDETQDFVQTYCEPAHANKSIENEVNELIADHSFAYALQSGGPVFFIDSTRHAHTLLHTLATPFQTRGMFVGQMIQNKEEILDTTLKLFSVIMLSAVNAIENLETQRFMRNHSQHLEQQVQNRTRELADANERMNIILNSMQSGVLVIEADTLRIIEANPKARQMFGCSLSELREHEIYPALQKPAKNADLPCSPERIEKNGDFFIIRKDGTEIPIQKTVSKVMIGGKLHLIENFIDISEQKKLADLKEDVDRIMRHDLKSPLNGIIGLPELLLMDDNLEESQKDILEHIRASGYKLLNMINLSLDLYKMETGSYRYTPSLTDIISIIRSVIKDHYELINWGKYKIVIKYDGSDIGESFQLPARCDEFLTYSLLSNLIKNSVEASPKNGTITMDFMRKDGTISLSINNMGVVPEEIRETFFGKYITANKPGGTGLGTYSARLIIETMGGNIAYTSTEEDGTTVYLAFPDVD